VKCWRSLDGTEDYDFAHSTMKTMRTDIPSGNVPCGYRPCNKAMVLICLVMLIGVLVISRTDIMLSSDCGPELSALIGGENLATYGFVKLRFLGVHYPGPPGDAPPYYLHYPPLPEILNGFLFRLGIQDLCFLRFIHGMLFVAGLVFMYAALGPFIGYAAIACGCGALATTTLFFEYSTSVHTHAYNMLFIGMFFFFFFRAADKGNSAREWVLCWVVLFLSSLTSFEFILYPLVFAFVYLLVEGKIKACWLSLVLLGLAPVAGVGFHFAQNCWAIGWSAAVSDKMGFGARGGGISAGNLAALGGLPTQVLQVAWRQLHIGWPSLVILSGVFLALRRHVFPKHGAHARGLVLGLLAASGAWYLFMPEFVVSHRCCADQLVPLFIVVIGMSVSLMLNSLARGNMNTAGKTIVISGFVLSIVLYQAYFLKPKFTNTRSVAQRIPRVIGAGAFPPKTSLVISDDIAWAFNYYCKRAGWPFGKGNGLNRDFLLSRQKYLAGTCAIRHFLYYAEDGGYLEDPLFQDLARRFEGKAKDFRSPGNASARLILFDVGVLLGPDDLHLPLEEQARMNQLKGVFPVWEIAGFDERLAKEFGE